MILFLKFFPELVHRIPKHNLLHQVTLLNLTRHESPLGYMETCGIGWKNGFNPGSCFLNEIGKKKA